MRRGVERDKNTLVAADDWKERFLRLRDENLQLKCKKNEHEDTIKRMYTKLNVLEEQLKTRAGRRVGGAEAKDSEPIGGERCSNAQLRRDLVQADQIIQALKQEIATLRNESHYLRERNRSLERKMRIRNGRCAKPHPFLSARTHGTVISKEAKTRDLLRRSQTTMKNGNCFNSSNSRSPRRTNKDDRLGKSGFRPPLKILDKQKSKAAGEKKIARISLESNQKNPDEVHENVETSSSDSGHNEGCRKPSRADIGRLKDELRDREAQISILNARYENLEYKYTVERELQEKTIEESEYLNHQIHKLRGQLHDLMVEKEELKVQSAKAQEAEREVNLVREQNRKLEERLTVLCESPFINDAFERKERMDRLFELEKKTEEQEARITSQNEDIKRFKGLNTDLKAQVARIKDTKRLLEEELEETTRHIIQDRHSYLRGATSVSIPIISTAQEEKQSNDLPKRQNHMRDASSSPVRLPSSPREVSQLEEKIKPSVSINVSAPDFDLAQLGDDITAGREYSSVRHLRNRIHTLQLAHAKSLQELERSERMLEVQTNINRELVTEIQDLTSRKIGSTQFLQKKIQEVEKNAQHREKLILDLKDRLRKLSKDLEEYQNIKSKGKELGPANIEEASDDTESLSESLAELARDLTPGQQVMEIYVRKAELDAGVWKEIDEFPQISCAQDYEDGSTVATFTLCDFYHFESQSTSLLKGYSPAFNTAMTFIITTDAFFLRFLASEILTFEVYQAIHSDFRLVGQCDFPLHTLLTSYSGAIKRPSLPIRGIHRRIRDVQLGTLNIEIRISSGLYDIWELHLQSFPGDRELISTSSDSDTARLESDISRDGNPPSTDSNSRGAVNDLEISVLACRNLVLFRYNKNEVESKPPSSYVHYHLLDYPDNFTGICADSRDPVFTACNRQTYTLKIDQSLLQFLDSSSLLFTVFDDNIQPVQDGDDRVQSDGMIGKVNVSLQALARGDSINQWFALSDSRGIPAGEIRLRLEWYDSLEIANLASMVLPVSAVASNSTGRAFNVEQLYKLMDLFSPEADGRIQYVSFYQFSIPTDAVEIVCARVRKQLSALIDSQRIHSLEHLMLDLTESVASSVMYENEAPTSHYVDWCHISQRFESVGIIFSTKEIQTLRIGLQGTLIDSTSAEGRNRIQDSVFLPYLLFALDPRLQAEIRLLRKISHETLRLYRDKTLENPIDVFRHYDAQGSGYVGRTDFKSALAQLGFVVLDQDYNQLLFSINKEAQMCNENINAACNQRETLALNRAKIACDSSRVESVSVNDEILDSSSVFKDLMVTQAPLSELKSGKAPHASVNADFARRREIFMKRMNALAAESSKSYVYEYLEKRGLTSKRKFLGSDGDHTKTRMPRHTDTNQRLGQVQQDAATTVQKVYRGYQTRNRFQSARKCEFEEQASMDEASLLEADQHLHILFRHFTSRDFRMLSEELDASLAHFPHDQQEPFTKKQVTYILRKIRHLTLEPSQIQVLINFFSSKHSDCVAVKALFHFIISAQAPWTFSAVNNAAFSECISMLDTIVLNIPRIIDIFEKSGDFKRKGVITVGRFREVLRRISLTNDSIRSISFQTLLFLTDSGAGTHFLYNAILECIFNSNATKKVMVSLHRLRAFGILELRQQLYTDSPMDGMLTLEHFSRILMQNMTNDDPPRPAFLSTDAANFFSLHSTRLEEGISIESLIAVLEQALKSESIREACESHLTYSLPQVQAICQNAVGLFRLKKSKILERFERFDWNRRGIVSLLEFRYILSEELTSGDVPCTGMPFALFLNKKQIKVQIAKHFGKRVKEKFGIDYRQFVDWIQYRGGHLGLPPEEILRCNADEMDVIETRLRAYTQSSKQESKASDILGSWRRTFLIADPANVGYLTRSLFAQCSAELQLPVDQQELRLILYFYDRFARDEIRYEKFLQLDWREGVKEEMYAGAKVVGPSFNSTEMMAKEDSRVRLDASMLMLELRTLLLDMAPSILKQRLEEIQGQSNDTESLLCSKVAFVKWMQFLGRSLSPCEVHTIFELYRHEKKLVEDELLDLHGFLTEVLGYDPFVRTLGTVNMQRDISGVVLDRMMALFQKRPDLKTSRKDLELFEQFLEENHVESISMSQIWNYKRCSEKFKERLQEWTRLMHISELRGADFATVKLETISLHKLCRFLRETYHHEEKISPLPYEDFKSSPSIGPATDVPLNLQPDNPLLRSLAKLIEAKEIDGDDLFNDFETIDTTHTGCVCATDFRDVLLRAGLTRYLSDMLPQNQLSTFDNAMGVFVRQYRLPEQQGDMIQYVVLLHHALYPNFVNPKLWGPLQAQVRLRSFLRQKAGLLGPILDYQDDDSLYGKLDNAFYHLDLARKGYLTIDDLESGMEALLEIVDTQATYLVNQKMGLFRNYKSSGRISRMEFDAFVMDPRAEDLLQRLTNQLCSFDENFNFLEQSCKAFDAKIWDLNDSGLIPTADFCKILTGSLPKGEVLRPFDHTRLEHLFDTRRTRVIAYKLFLNVIYQYRQNGAASYTI
ncbi:hypothetical protein ABG067_003351 [Albugo candida]